jgi:hypothetical protein
MLKSVSWAVAFATRLLFARAVSETGVDPISGAPVKVIPANMWPPHRPRPTQPTHRMSRNDKGKRVAVDRLQLNVIQGRLGFVPVTKLVGGKGLRP